MAEDEAVGADDGADDGDERCVAPGRLLWLGEGSEEGEVAVEPVDDVAMSVADASSAVTCSSESAEAAGLVTASRTTPTAPRPVATAVTVKAPQSTAVVDCRMATTVPHRPTRLR